MAAMAAPTETHIHLADCINDAFQPLLYNKDRYLILVGGGGSGKSIFAAQKTIIRCMQGPGHLILACRKVGVTIKHTVVRALFKVMSDWGVEKLWHYHKQDGVLRYIPNGSEIMFLGLDDTEKIKSLEGLTGVWIEEGTELNRNEFVQVDIRLRGESPHYHQIMVTFNPIDTKHFLNKDFFEEPVYDAASGGVTMLRTTYRDNRFLNDQSRNQLENLSRVDANLHRIYALGEWGQITGLVFGEQEWTDREWPTDESYTEDRIVYGVDFGYNHPSAIVRCYVGDGFLHFDEVLYATGLTTADLISAMREEVDSYSVIYCDSAEPDRIEEIARAGFSNVAPAVKGKGSIRAGIDHIKSNQVFVTPRTVNGKKEKAAYK